MWVNWFEKRQQAEVFTLQASGSHCICSWCQSRVKGGQEQIQVVYEGSVVWISSDRTQDRVRSYTGLTSGLNDLPTNLLPSQLNSLWLDLFGSHQWKVTILWDFSPQRLMAAILPVRDLRMAGRRDDKWLKHALFFFFLTWVIVVFISPFSKKIKIRPILLHLQLNLSLSSCGHKETAPRLYF